MIMTKWIDAYYEKPKNEEDGTLFLLKIHNKERGLFRVVLHSEKLLREVNNEKAYRIISKWRVHNKNEWLWKYVEDDELITFL